MSQRITARCHCRTVIVTAELMADTLEPGRCSCSFCARRQAGNVSVHSHSVIVEQGEDRLSMYQFGTKTARHYFCSICGIYTHHQRYSNPSETGVNIACIDGVNVWTHEPIPWNHEMRDT